MECFISNQPRSRNSGLGWYFEKRGDEYTLINTLKHFISYFLAPLILITITVIFIEGCSKSQNPQVAAGERTFKTICASCHTINGGVLFGPDLNNVDKNRPEVWIIKFVKSSQTVVQSGDSAAVAIFNEFKPKIMPDQPALTDDDIRAVISYIKNKSTGGGVTTPQPIKVSSKAANSEVAEGRQMFLGEKPFTNGGPACITCHHVAGDTYLGGGTLAIDLNGAFNKYKDEGLQKLLENPPAPVMNTAFTDKELTDTEKYDIRAFLYDVQTHQAYDATSDYQNRFFIMGIAGFVMLSLIIGIVWIDRKRRTVKYSILRRNR